MNQKINSYYYLIVVTAILLLPLLYIHQTANTINPFHLNGKQFLTFFSLLTVTSFVTGIIWMNILQRQDAKNSSSITNRRLTQQIHCVVFVLAIGFARLVQGISNHKPVGYLLLLLLLNFSLLLLIKSRKNLP